MFLLPGGYLLLTLSGWDVIVEGLQKIPDYSQRVLIDDHASNGNDGLRLDFIDCLARGLETVGECNVFKEVGNASNILWFLSVN